LSRPPLVDCIEANEYIAQAICRYLMLRDDNVLHTCRKNCAEQQQQQRQPPQHLPPQQPQQRQLQQHPQPPVSQYHDGYPRQVRRLHDLSCFEF
jgi:hypothetical protein